MCLFTLLIRYSLAILFDGVLICYVFISIWVLVKQYFYPLQKYFILFTYFKMLDT